MIDTKAIRNRLISLAVSGKLVEQNRDEGNANELVEKLSKLTKEQRDVLFKLLER